MPRTERLHVGVALVGQVDQLQQVADHLAPPGGRNAVAAGEEVEVLPDPHVVVDAERVGHVADGPAHRVRLAPDAVAADLRVARGGHEQRREHLERRGLARAVGPDEPEDLALLDLEVDARHGHRAPVALDQPDRPDRDAHLTVPSSRLTSVKPTSLPSAARFTNRTTKLPDAST